MHAYVSACLSRVKGLIGEYEAAAEEVHKAHIEYRECRTHLNMRESERLSLLGLLEHWKDDQFTPFEQKDMIASAVKSLVSLRREIS